MTEKAADLLSVSMRFAANLRRFREAAGISQEDLAFAAEIHRTQVSFIEGGHRMPRLDTLMKVAAALAVTPNDLVEGITWEPSVHRPGGFRVGAPDGDDG